jgi:hypothetical protein
MKNVVIPGERETRDRNDDVISWLTRLYGSRLPNQ